MADTQLELHVHTDEFVNIGVVGGGAWGTALASHCSRMGHNTLLWALESEVVTNINDQNQNPWFLPGITLPDGLKATQNLEEVMEHGDIILMVVPSSFVAATLQPVADKLTKEKILVSCTKGILQDTLETVNAVLERVFPAEAHSRLAYLSGPSFAAEVANQLPTAVTIAAKDDSVASRVQLILSTSRFRCYKTTDVAGVELGGALKNVLAIACGICDGLQFGHNGRAALITRGMNEITRIAVAKGASPLTLSGLSGIGDIILTCTGDLSRNRTVGLRIGRGEKLADITKSMKSVAEGVKTSEASAKLAEQLGLDCPILTGIYRVLHGGEDPVAVVSEAMSRSLKPEVDPTIQQMVPSHT